MRLPSVSARVERRGLAVPARETGPARTSARARPAAVRASDRFGFDRATTIPRARTAEEFSHVGERNVDASTRAEVDR